eukprot:1673264-Alexandrium_andersonii.AAC.1
MLPSTCPQEAAAGAGRSCMTRNSCCHDLGGWRSPAMAAISLRAAAHSAERRNGAVPLAAPKSRL